jgi:hypothetical protein
LLWNKLGLTWPIEDYNELLKPDCPPDPFEYIVTRKDGTLHIGQGWVFQTMWLRRNLKEDFEEVWL